jgi:hypothetical protein
VYEDVEEELRVEVLAAALRMDTQAAGDLLESLAVKLSGSLPENTTVRRGGWFLSSKKPVEEINVRFDEAQYQIVRERHGSFTAREMKIVRGVVLKTSDVPVDKWISDLAQDITEIAQQSSATRQALKKFVVG